MTIAIIILLLFLALLLFLIFPARSTREQRSPFQNRSFAHRGLHTEDKTVPENSLAAFKAAVEAGYGIELDVRLTKDDKVIVFHDDSLKRICGISGNVRDFTYEELKKLTLYNTSEHIPLFEDVLKLVDGRVPLLVEFKFGYKPRLLCENATKLLDRYKGVYCMESFDPRIVHWFKKNAKNILRGQLSAPSYILGHNVVGFLSSHLLFNFISRPQFIAYYEKKTSLLAKLCDHLGAMKFVWTVSKDSNLGKMLRKNDAIIFEHIVSPRFICK